jgi:hypothetical protein
MSRRTKARKWWSFAGTTLVISVVARLSLAPKTAPARDRGRMLAFILVVAPRSMV